jgi:trimeric autotransporter adhesin
VSWQVTGIRHDAWANAHRIPVQEDKPQNERGFYLHPDLYNQSPERSVDWARHDDVTKRIAAQR